MRLAITHDGVTSTFVEAGADGPYPWLTGFGELVFEARAGHLESVGKREAANMTFELDNTERQAATLLGYPVRAAVTAYDDDDNELLSGLAQALEFGPKLIGTIEA